MATIPVAGKQVSAADEDDAHFLSLRRAMVHEQIIRRGIGVNGNAIVYQKWE
jgi:hypothetical protein